MKLDYGTLLSFEPLKLNCGCSIKSPTLKEVSRIGFHTYYTYLFSLSLDIPSYYKAMDIEEGNDRNNYDSVLRDKILKIRKEYEALSAQEKEKVSVIDIILYDRPFTESIAAAIAFFTDSNVTDPNVTDSNVIFSIENRAFFILNQGNTVGVISKEMFPLVTDLILQRNGIRKKETGEKPKFKSKLAEQLYYRTLDAKNQDTAQKADKTLELPNIISAVSAYHNSINMLNVWDMTVYQLYDQFHRLQYNTLHQIQAMSVAAYGDEKNKFDIGQWYKNMPEL